MIIAPAALIAIYAIIVDGPQRYLKIKRMEKMEDSKEMESTTCGASIYLSMIFFVSDLIASATGLSAWAVLLSIPAVLVSALFIGRQVYAKEIGSSQYAKRLADSLHNRNWIKRFGRRRKRGIEVEDKGRADVAWRVHT
jgi:ABC-type xylose transport system permease subunit